MDGVPHPPAQAFLGEPRHSGADVAERSGLDLETARRIRRALGMPDAADDEVLYDDDDVEAMAALRSILDLGFPLHDVLTVTRAYGTALARVADAETRLFRERVLEPMVADGATPDEVTERVRPVVDVLLRHLGRLLDQGHRRHLMVALDALGQRGGSESERAAAGFVDLVDFSRISGDLPGDELGAMVDSFEELAVEVCSNTGVRLVKVIGDAAMFVSPEGRRALEAARTIVRLVEQNSVLPQARSGVDLGEVVAVGGDYFGRPVNTAARITAFAYPGTVVVSRELLDDVGGDGVTTSRIGTERLKGVGRVELFKVKDA
ncbi:MAG TPA: adenylate cyclase regulatory domain-containing protein [Actinomycetota bacterium]|nr:adenylate cyclase regulatory domain-containing protein [Actinomycetota bacterium]